MRKIIEHRRTAVTRRFSLRDFRERLGITECGHVVRATDMFGDVEVVMSPQGGDWAVYHYTRSEFLERLGLPQVTWFSAFPWFSLLGYYVKITYFEPVPDEAGLQP